MHFVVYRLASRQRPNTFKTNERILDGLEGVVCEMDDILVFGENQTQHDKRLMDVLQRLEKCGVTLNSEKCEFSVRSVKFVGHIIGEDGISADPLKVKAIIEMDKPSNITELRRFLGMANQLSKFTIDLAETTKPLRDLLSKKMHGIGLTHKIRHFSM